MYTTSDGQWMSTTWTDSLEGYEMQREQTSPRIPIEKICNLVEYFLANKQLGHTQCVIENLTQDALYLVLNQNQKAGCQERTQARVVSLSSLPLRGYRSPMAVDHHVLLEICLTAIDIDKERLNLLSSFEQADAKLFQITTDRDSLRREVKLSIPKYSQKIFFAKPPKLQKLNRSTTLKEVSTCVFALSFPTVIHIRYSTYF